MQTQEVKIDSHKATKWLENMATNRLVSQNLVERYARDMRNGKWRKTGEPIIFDEDGKLVDGQHRMWAVIESGCTIEMLVVRGVPLDAIHNIDTGKPRSTAQVMQILGGSNTVKTVSVARALDGVVSPGRVRNLSVDEVEAVLAKWPGVKWILEQPGAMKSGKLSQAPVLAAFAIVHSKNQGLARDSWEAFSTGANLAKGDPLLTLRNYLTDSLYAKGTASSAKSSLTRRTLTAIAYRAAGRELHRVQDGSEGLRTFLGVRKAAAIEQEAAQVEAKS